MTTYKISALKNLRQIGKLEQYINSFESMLKGVEVSEKQAMGWFVNGLKSEIQRTILLFEPCTLHGAYFLAQLKDSAIA